jgi:hypothetical protein
VTVSKTEVVSVLGGVVTKTEELSLLTICEWLDSNSVTAPIVCDDRVSAGELVNVSVDECTAEDASPLPVAVSAVMGTWEERSDIVIDDSMAG